MTAIKKIYKKSGLILLLVMMGSLLYVPQQVSALTLSEAIEACSIRIKKPQCEAAVRACTTSACRTNAVNNTSISGARVVSFCRVVQDPQKCQSDYVEKCGGKRDAVLERCVTEFKATLTTTAAATGGGSASGTSTSPISLSEKNIKKGTPCGRDTETTKAVNIQFDIGCEQKADNPIVDMLYALIKFLTIGVGLVLTISIILAGIMYTTSGGSAEQTTKAKDRILNAMIGLIFYLLISALANFLIPGGLF